jgi:protein gp37
MAQDTKIEWAHHTVNLWHGCTEVHEGCDNCYARVLNKRFQKENANWGHDVPRLAIKSAWKDLDRFQKKAAEAGEIHRVFVGSMMDIFEKPMPLVDSNVELNKNENTGNLRFHLFYRIDRGDYPNLMFLFLTKRPSNINKYIFESWKTNPPSNVMFGTSVVNQETANKLIPQLLQVKGKKFLSCEPLLGEVRLDGVAYSPDKNSTFSFNVLEGTFLTKGDIEQIDWVICGGESGHNARPMHPDWARSLRDQCKAAGVPFLFKQWGEWASNHIHMGTGQMVFSQFLNFDMWVNKASTWVNGGICLDKNGHQLKNGGDMMRARDEQRFPVTIMHKVGKTTASKLLDGVEYLEFPKP